MNSTAASAPSAPAPAPASPAPAAPQRRWPRRLAWLLLILLLALLAALGVLWRWAASPGSLEQALAWAAPHLPPALHIEQLQGSLLHGGQAGRVRWSEDGLTVEVQQARLRWRLLSLLGGKLHLDELAAARIQVDDTRPPDPEPTSGPPRPISLPLRIIVRSFRVDELHLAQQKLRITDVAGSYHFNQLQHRLELGSVKALGGSYSASVRLANDAAAMLNASLRGQFSEQSVAAALPEETTAASPAETSAETAPAPAAALPATALLLRATAVGPLSNMQITARLREQTAAQAQETPAASAELRAEARADAQTARAELSARIAPWAAQPITQAHIHLNALDVAPFWPTAPHTRLSGQVHLNPDDDRGWRAELDLSNALAGPWSARQLPLQSLKTSVHWRPKQTRINSLLAELPGGASVQASGRYALVTAPVAVPAEIPAEIPAETHADTPAESAEAPPAPLPAWQLQARIGHLTPAALHADLPGPAISGTLQGQSAGGVAPLEFDVDLQADEASAAAAVPAASPASAQAPGGALLAGLRQLVAQGQVQPGARGDWAASQLELARLSLHTAQARLNVQDARARLAERAGQGQISLDAPGLKFSAQGQIAPASGKGQMSLQAAKLADTLRWLQSLPLPPAARASLEAMQLGGSASFKGQWQGGWAAPAFRVQAAAPALQWRASAGDEWLHLKALNASAQGSVKNARLQTAALTLSGQASQAGRRLDLRSAARLRQTGASQWQAAFSQLDVSAQDAQYAPAAWRVALHQPFTLTASLASAGKEGKDQPGGLQSLAASAGALHIHPPAAARPQAPAQLAWQELQWRDAGWLARGRLGGLPLAWADQAPEPWRENLQTLLDVAGSFVLNARWEGDYTPAHGLRLQASAERASGDIVLPPLPGAPQRQSAGVKTARVDLNVQGAQASARLDWQSERIGQAAGELSTRIGSSEGGPFDWPAQAPLQGQLKAKLPPVAAWSLLAPPGWRLRGAVDADLQISGTRAAPQLGGLLKARELALRSVADGFELKDGQLLARLQGEQVLIEQFTLKGGKGGQISATGSSGWAQGQMRASLKAQLDRFQPSIRADRQITLSGDMQAAMQGSAATLDGKLRFDQAHIELPESSAPTLDDDVRIHRADGRVLTASELAEGGQGQTRAERAAARAAQKQAKTTLAARLDIDMGPAFTLRGQGIDTRLAGVLQVAASGPIGTLPRVTGEIRTEGGTFRAYSQQLQIQKGVVRFTGPADNPVLDILALRPNYQSDQRAGVRVTGTALLPSVRLYSRPELSDSQTLSWLLLGRAAPAGGAEAAMLQQAALAAMSGRGGKSLASRVGLDELSVNEGGSVAVGKRLSDKLYASYEQTLGSAIGSLFIYYELSRRWLVRGQTGQQQGLDVIYRISYD